MKTAIIVDDDEELLHFYRQLLSCQDIHSVLASSTEKALQIMKESKVVFDYLLTDYAMPDKSGVELIVDAHKYNFLPEQVIIISSVVYEIEAIWDLKMKYPSLKLLNKPFVLEDFFYVVNT